MEIQYCELEMDENGKELMQHGREEFPLAIYNDVLEIMDVAWHWHDELEMIYVLEGEGLFAFGDQKKVLKAREGCLINAGVLHGCWCTELRHCVICSVVFHPRLLGGNSESVFMQKYVSEIIMNPLLQGIFLNPEKEWHKRLLDCLKQSWDYCKESEEGFELVTRNLLSEMLLLIYKRKSKLGHVISNKSKRDGERIKIMLHYIQENYMESIKMSELAAVASVSESECLRCFKKTIGLSPSQFIKNYRIQKACELLKERDLTVAEIGSRCGFSDESYFVKCFREIKGITPAKYGE